MLRLLDPHTAHKTAISLLRLSFPYPKISDPHTVFGVDFPNRLGLSAGFDKDAVALKGLGSFGFGHVEVGTTSLAMQRGHDPQYIDRQPKAINNLGLPNVGVNQMVLNIKKCRPKGLVLGGSLAYGDLGNPEYDLTEIYETFIRLRKNVDYIVLNASCPNVETPENIYKCLRLIDHTETTPVLVKLHIMEDKMKLKSTLRVLNESRVKGVVCSNTLPTTKGGLSGKPLIHMGHQQLEWVKENSDYPVISSGVMTPQDAVDRIRLGADLVQVYTGFVYGGLTFPYRVAKAMRDL